MDDTTRASTPFPGGWLFGTVVTVETSRDLLFLRTQETRKREVIQLVPETQFAVDGHPGSSNDLRLGQRVRILLDLNMPDTDGWKAFDVIARLASDVPVIVITARPGQARRAAEAGIDMLLEKPLDIPMLLETIRNLLASPETSSFARVLRAWRTNDLLGSQG